MFARPPSAKQSAELDHDHNTILNDFEERIGLTCSICSHPFDSAARKPKIICRRQHTYCQQCLLLIQKTRPFRCPECRFKVYHENIFINRTILDICEFLPRLRQGIDQKQDENEKLKIQNEVLRNQLLRMRTLIGKNQKNCLQEPKARVVSSEQKQSESTFQKKKENKEVVRRRTVTVQKIQQNGWFHSPARKLKTKKENHLTQKINNPQLQLDFRKAGHY